MAQEEQLQIAVDPMRVRDLADILKIERLSFPTPWSKTAFLSELLENDRAYYLVARLHDRAVGYIGMWLISGEAHITNVAVHPHWRSRGVGRRLLETVAELARLRSCRRVTLEVRVTNHRAQTLYESLGFVGAGIRKGYYRDNNEDAIVMWKEL